jgi:hypothetical protein
MYTTIGPNGKGCKHEHETFDEAQECLHDFLETCRKANKVANRVVVECNSLEELEDELDQMAIY